MPPGALQAKSLAALPGIRHAFFTREGGVSQGIYASLNGGVGSADAREHVAENRVGQSLDGATDGERRDVDETADQRHPEMQRHAQLAGLFAGRQRE